MPTAEGSDKLSTAIRTHLCPTLRLHLLPVSGPGGAHWASTNTHRHRCTVTCCLPRRLPACTRTSGQEKPRETFTIGPTALTGRQGSRVVSDYHHLRHALAVARLSELAHRRPLGADGTPDRAGLRVRACWWSGLDVGMVTDMGA